ncbi:MAG: hypothetical protein MUC33_14710 [Desulfobacterales bacterium]|nr:hypothetical protein [Desulfobacterales bacterium]
MKTCLLVEKRIDLFLWLLGLRPVVFVKAAAAPIQALLIGRCINDQHGRLNLSGG